MRRTTVLAILIACLVCSSAFADQIILKNGDRFTGTILKSDEKSLLLKTEFVGEVTVQWAAIQEINSTQPLHIGLKDGEMIVGQVSTSDGKFQIDSKEAGKVSTPKDAVQLIRSDSEQAAYDAQMERLRHPRLLDFWSGFIDTGISATKGNSDTFSFTLGASAIRTTTRDKFTIYSNSIFAKNSATGTSVTTAKAIRGGIRGDFNLTPRLFAFGFTDFEYDKFQKLDLRNVLGGGLGFHAFKNERTTFDLFGGASYNQEFFSTGLDRKSAELVVGEELIHKLSDRMFLNERLSFYPNLSDTGEYRLTFDASAVIKLSRWLNWQITFADRYLSDPIPETKKNDLLLSTGLRLTFGK